jgi:ATP-dependent Clp protease ATP-binding subunit ClpA
LTNDERDDRAENGSSSPSAIPNRPKRSESIFAEASNFDMNESPHQDSVNDVLSRLSPRAKRVLETGREEATSLGATSMCTQHLLLGMLRHRDCCAARILEDLGFEYDEVRRRIVFINGIQSNSRVAPESLEFSPRLNHAIDVAGLDATRRGHTQVGTTHFLVSLLRAREGLVVTVLETAGLGLEPVGAAIVRAFRADAAHDPTET